MPEYSRVLVVRIEYVWQKKVTKDCATVRVVKASGRLLESILVVLKSIRERERERERVYSRLRRQKKIKKLLISRRLSKH